MPSFSTILSANCFFIIIYSAVIIFACCLFPELISHRIVIICANAIVTENIIIVRVTMIARCIRNTGIALLSFKTASHPPSACYHLEYGRHPSAAAHTLPPPMLAASQVGRGFVWVHSVPIHGAGGRYARYVLSYEGIWADNYYHTPLTYTVRYDRILVSIECVY